MAKREAKPAPKLLQPDEPLALTVATAYARQATISLARAERPHPARAREDHAHLCDAEAMLTGALEIVVAHKDKLAVKL